MVSFSQISQTRIYGQHPDDDEICYQINVLNDNCKIIKININDDTQNEEI